jgi:hypothetical protein
VTTLSVETWRLRQRLFCSEFNHLTLVQVMLGQSHVPVNKIESSGFPVKKKKFSSFWNPVPLAIQLFPIQGTVFKADVPTTPPTDAESVPLN